MELYVDSPANFAMAPVDRCIKRTEVLVLEHEGEWTDPFPCHSPSTSLPILRWLLLIRPDLLLLPGSAGISGGVSGAIGVACGATLTAPIVALRWAKHARARG